MVEKLYRCCRTAHLPELGNKMYMLRRILDPMGTMDAITV